ncbi:efflux RND transporter permease subunit [Candidatus Venteria ishoeyi]|uniref:Putative efflux pump membrane transporter TtgB n=1 Tax=Candidatus Venteria ishoeyi TaxID=1899563 RepID=A0A1H6FCB8_9GAMM|nr:efflux RND transporter permease subunit [Candidatus Venteria ishoeyi]SEH06969.1 putative efflux pump membrane transporter TtgB [Candidatus Venteria ishoeyi]
MQFQHKTDLIGRFAQHKVAANLLMVVMLLAGIGALSKLNTQILPSFDLDFITIVIPWSGASPEDVERSITSPAEEALRTLDNVKKMTSTSGNNVAAITLEYQDNSDMGIALDQVNEKIALLRNLPSTAEKPEISRVVRYEPIARILLYGTDSAQAMRPLAHQIEQELLRTGLSKVTISGLPKEEIAIQIASAKLEELGLTLNQVGQKIKAYSQDMPAGSIGLNDISRQLRGLEQRRDQLAFLDIPLFASRDGQRVLLGDIASVKRRPMPNQTTLYYQGQPAVELQLLRADKDDALKLAKKMQTWLAENQDSFPPNIHLKVYDQSWRYIQGRINILLKNGLGGLILVILVLYLFLNAKVAWWVAVGIPVSLMAAQAVLYAFGGTINMVSLLAMIMTLGIIVDDAIVVGEDALAHYQNGENPLESSEGGARRMLAPVMASSLTSIAAFMPLMLVGGIIGHILFAIPLVVIAVILASLVESFLILPGHLRHSFLHLHHQSNTGIRHKLDTAFEKLRDNYFRPLIHRVLQWRILMVAILLSLLMLGISLLVSGKVPFNFFPTPEPAIVNANINFISGTPPQRVSTYLEQLEQALYETDKALSPAGESLIVSAVVRQGMSQSADGQSSRRGDQFASIFVELIEPDQRSVRNNTFLDAWKDRVDDVPGLESLVISERRGGPPGRDIDIKLSGDDALQLKQAALELKTALKAKANDGVRSVEDDMPYGREQLLYQLRPLAIAYGLTTTEVGQQLRAAFDGLQAQIFLDGRDEVEVRVMLADEERHSLSALEQFKIHTPQGLSLPLRDVVDIKSQRGFETLRHAEGELTIQVSADVNAQVRTSNEIISELEQQILPEISSRYGVHYSYEGRAADQRETMQDMMRGLFFALILIYLVLAWVFASYGWPLVVMSVIPFGLIGALAGHWAMDLNLTILSLFGLFGLSGIVINDSIVLITFYQRLRKSGLAVNEALVEAACQRLRAVLLTSLTTIFGLMPLLFETSLQAQFLIPMAVSISFGLAFGTVLVLLLVPTLLSLYEDFHVKLFQHKPGKASI